MAARTPAEAVETFLEPLQRAVSCVTRSVLVGRRYRPGESYTLALRRDLQVGRATIVPDPTTPVQ